MYELPYWQVGVKLFLQASVRCFLFFSPNDSPSKLWKMLFVSSKKLSLFSRYSHFCISVLPWFPPPVGHCFSWWSKINLKVYDVISCLNKNLITHFDWYLEKARKTLAIVLNNRDKVINKEHFYGNIIQKMYIKS